MKLSYQNPAGWIFDTRVATDTTVVNAPVLAISKRDAPDPVLAGRSITYTLSYTNAGSAAATGVVITDAVPMSTTYQTCSGGSVCGVVGDVISWTLGTVPSQTSGTVSFSVRVSDTLATGTLIRNEEYGIVAEQTDPVSGPSVTTLVNRDAGLFEGYTYIDANGDGVYEPGSEDTLTGVTITLTSATVPITTTDSDGYYRFRVESTGAISVTAALPDGYFRTTPRAVYTDSVFGITQTVNFGYAPATSGFGVIYGTVFEDANHDAVRDLGEKGLVGVTVESSEAMTPSVTTNAYGQYALRYDVSGGVTITESNLNLYVSTTPDVVHTGAVIGSSGPSPVDFGDFYGLKITGRVFDDVNVNGINDAEEGISGATVTAASESLTTASTGVYTLYVVVSDNLPILISETDPAGYISTNAVPGGGMSRVDANTLRIDSPVSGGTYTSADFGDVLASSVITISGQVWDDNGEGEGGLANGLRDGAEPGLAGSVVRVSSGLTQTTAADGLFRLYAPPGQPITITEANPPGYLSTNAIPGDDASKLDDDTLVVVAPGSGSTSADNLFGDVSTSSLAVITGTVFDDANENGVLDGSESGLASITVTLEANGGGSIPVLTDASGNYQFAVVPGTDVRITSTRPEGSYYPTTLESVVLSPLEPGLFADNNFGYSDDSDVAVIMGVVFDDVNSDGEQGIGELGLSGAVITLDGASPVTTTVNGLITGTFTYSVTRDGVYALHEKNPSGYRSTTPDDIQVQANLGNSYAVAFGDTNSLNTASIHGIAFDDVNGNGLQDPTETGLPGVIISVTINADPGVLTTTTGAYGQFHYGFGVSEVGYHTVAEQDPAKPSYRSTTPDEVTLEVLMGNSYSVSFGDTTTATFSSIMGVVFDDWNGDGAQDLTEPGISGVLISLSEGISTTTNSYGGYTLPVTTTGPVRVMETDPVGYHSTTPNTVTVKLASLGKVYVVGFGDSSNRTVSSIFGTVFEDENIDGAWDLAEIPLSGVPVAIASASNGVLGPTMTNNWGQFTFLIEVTDVYTLTESDLPGYLSTNAIPGNPAVTKVDNHTLRTVVKTLGTDLGENLFGDVLESRVNPDILMRKEANTSTSEVGEIITYTYSVTNTGNTSLDLVNASDDRLGPVLLGSMSLRPGASTSGTLAYTVAEGDLPGPIVNTATVTGTSLVGRDVTDSDAVSVSLSNFSTISGRVFEDIDGDGEQDAGEAGIPDVLITLDGATTTTTGSNGDYAFFTAAAGFHIVVETDPEGYFSTTPNQVYIEVSLGNSYEVDFGDAPETSEFATLYGTVFEDIDGDGEWDVSEVGLKGVAITLGGAMGTTTDEDGGYSFHLTEGGVYTVVETDPEGYSSSTPNEVQVEVNLGNSYRVDFGDTLVSVCTCPADGYEEDDLVVQATELRVGERQMHDFCDDASDWSYFSAQAGQVYTITTSSWGQRADTFLALFDTDGQSLLASSDDYQGTTDYSSRVRWQAPESGMYYVRTRNRAALSGCLTDYEVWIEQRDRLHVYLPLVMRNLNEAQALGQALEAYPTGVIDHACPDNHEVDDTWEQAQLLEPNMWQVHSFDSDPEYYAADKDFVWFDVQARQTITFSVAELTHTVTLLELYDEHGVPLNVTGTTQLVWRADTAGRYHLSASPQTAAYGCADEVGYRLSMEMSPLRAVYLPLVLRSFTVP
ncbi:MAG: SdrD B-like domain-containing protein [Anaerolineae bacterium]